MPGNLAAVFKECVVLQMAEIIAFHSRRSVEEVEHDIDRDYFMTAREALDYGLIDDIITPRRGVAAGDLVLAGAAAAGD